MVSKPYHRKGTVSILTGDLPIHYVDPLEDSRSESSKGWSFRRFQIGRK